ncbi:MAG: MaoC family dehydratase [Sneathiellaceae bacterium]
MRYFEDIGIGDREETGSYLVTEAEILDFAGQFDPQPFHLDPVAAAEGPFGQLAASGWHTLGIMMHLLVSGREAGMPGLPSPGFEKLEWRRPVFAGDRLRVVSVTAEKRPSRSKPIGIVKFATQVLNQDDAVVLEIVTIGRYRLRAAAGGSG